MFRAIAWFLFSFLVPGAGLWSSGRRGLAFAAWSCSQVLLTATLYVYAEDPLRWVWVLVVGAPLASAVTFLQAVGSAVAARQRSVARWWSTAIYGVGIFLADTAMNVTTVGRVTSYSVPSASMMPSLVVGDTFFSLLDEERFPLHRGDPIVFENPDTAVTYVKRLIGFPNDTVAWDGERLTINDRPLSVDEPCGEQDCRLEGLGKRRWRVLLRCDGKRCQGGPTGSWTVPEGHFFVMGDNRGDSLDSRSTGPIPDEWFVGTARVIHFSWPHVSRIGRPIDPAP